MLLNRLAVVGVLWFELLCVILKSLVVVILVVDSHHVVFIVVILSCGCHISFAKLLLSLGDCFCSVVDVIFMTWFASVLSFYPQLLSSSADVWQVFLLEIVGLSLLLFSWVGVALVHPPLLPFAKYWQSSLIKLWILLVLVSCWCFGRKVLFSSRRFHFAARARILSQQEPSNYPLRFVPISALLLGGV